jgi:hypothetical protein
MAWDASSIASATPWAALSGKLQALVGGAGVANWSFVEQIPAGIGAGCSGAAAYKVDVFKCAGAGTDANAATTDWFFCLEIPVADGAVASNCMAFESYDPTTGQKKFKRPIAQYAVAPVGAGYWASDTYAPYASVQYSNRSTMVFTALNTYGFSYWIKLTNNGIQIAMRVSTTECSLGVHLLDSLTIVTDAVPLMSLGSTWVPAYHTLPGVTVAPSSYGWSACLRPWISIVDTGWLSNVTNAQDLWLGGKLLLSRLVALHGAGAYGSPITKGLVRGLMKVDFMCFRPGGVVSLGDTLSFDGHADWTVITPGYTFGAGGYGTSMIIVTRAN